MRGKAWSAASVPNRVSSGYRALALTARSLIVAGAIGLTTTKAPAQQPFVKLDGDPKTEAWWVIARFQPFTTEVRGIPVNQIRKTWCKATEFRKDLIPKELLIDETGVDAMQAAGMSFAIEGRFDGSATQQVALVGVYQDCGGKPGSFLLILDQPQTGKAKVRFVHEVPTDHPFSVLQKGKDNTIVVWSCMECDDASVLGWDRKKRRFAFLPQPDE